MGDIHEGQLFKIGAVASLTGASVHTIRKWEERYGAVEPERSAGGKRLYSENDVQRLALIKKLADRGMSLQSIAGSSLDELAARWQQIAAVEEIGTKGTSARVAVFGAGLAASLKIQAKPSSGLEIIAAANDELSLLRQLTDKKVDVLLVECPAIVSSSAQQIREMLERFDVPAAVIVYRFGARRHVEALQSWGIAVLRAPAEFGAVRAAVTRALAARSAPKKSSINSLVATRTEQTPRPPRFSSEALATMALSNPNANCECQKNLVDVVLSLRALEEYLGGCESRSPEDEEMHRTLWQKVCEARSSIEDAIEHFAAVEGISLDEQQIG